MLMPLKKWTGFGVVLIAFGLSAYLTYFKSEHGGLELAAIRRDDPDLPQHLDIPEEMVSLTDLYRTINFIQKRYIDTARIDPRAMFVGAMRAIQLNVAQMLVREGEDELTIKVGSTEKRFLLDELKSVWVLLQRMKEVFQLLSQEFTEDEVDFGDVEYAAINGMLRTLDPHSVFLNAEQYRDMKDKTQGNFAGLGIVISIRDGVLTIISPIDGTPADEAGLQAGDQIIKIDEESTVNMSLNDAVDLLRGDPGTTVTVHILRKGWDEPKPFVIARAIVKVDSLESHLLSGKVGYIKIKDFQGNTAEDINAEMLEWARSRIKGLVLDLRGCPGGLLEAAVQVADLFLKKGVIVTTAGQGLGEREIRRAEASGNEPDYPLVVLVDQGSASASEILAGALKNHKRALLLGERTFGKGSVQVLFEFHGDEPNKTTALKLTTAQYLTPGDISIQSVGIVPHIEVLPMRADDEVVDLEVIGGYRESDLTRHFKGAASEGNADRALQHLSYLWEPPPADKEEGDDPDGGTLPKLGKDRPFEPDFMVKLARDVVIRTATAEQGALDFDVVSKLIADRSEKEDGRLESALRKLGIDWRLAKGSSDAAALKVSVDFKDGEVVEAGQSATVAVTVTNKGQGTFYRMAATSDSDFRPLDDRELAFGRIGPKATVSRELKFKIPQDALTEVNDVRFTFRAENSDVPKPAAYRFAVKALPVPRFAYTTRIDDTKKGNGNGRLEQGETVDLVVEVHNSGKGAALNTYVTLKSLSDKELFMIRGRDPLERIEPDQQKDGVFTFKVKPGFREKQARFELAIADVDLKAYLVEKISIPIAAPKSPTPTATPEKPKPSSPPVIRIDAVDMVTASETIRFRGTATDETAVRDVYIFVGDDKLFFKSNQTRTPEALTFEAELPLKNGINYITVVAEETAELEARKIIAVRRDRQDGMPYVMSRTPDADPELLGVFPLNARETDEQFKKLDLIAAPALVEANQGPRQIPDVAKGSPPPRAAE